MNNLEFGGRTPILIAISSRHEAVARWLIEHDASLATPPSLPGAGAHPGARARVLSVVHASAQHMSVPFNADLWRKVCLGLEPIPILPKYY